MAPRSEADMYHARGAAYTEAWDIMRGVLPCPPSMEVFDELLVAERDLAPKAAVTPQDLARLVAKHWKPQVG